MDADQGHQAVAEHDAEDAAGLYAFTAAEVDYITALADPGLGAERLGQ